MFRRIVSNLSFSPALVGQLGFYAKRLRKEESTRRIGLIFTALALVVQSLAVFSPPEPANAASPSDFISGGFSNLSEYLRVYDRNVNNIKDIYTSLGITRAEIASAKRSTINSKEVYSWGMTSRFSAAQGERTYHYAQSNGGRGTVFYRPLRLWDSLPYTIEHGSTYSAFVGHSKKFGWFGMMLACGNLVTKTPPVPDADCVNLAIAPLSPTRFRFTGKASKQEGAQIHSYIYRVRNASNALVAEIPHANHDTTDQVEYTQTTPGSYTVRLIVKASTGVERDSNCVGNFTVAASPVAECRNVVAVIQNRTDVSLSGSATAQNGATIKSYTFVVKDKDGKVVKSIPVNSSAQAVSAPTFTLDKPGNYSVALTVGTSLGPKTNSTTCVKSFTITKPEVCQYNPSLPVNSPDCQPCAGNPEIWIKDEKCVAEVISTKSGINMTQGNVAASSVIAKASDKLSYTLMVENKGVAPQPVTMTENLADVLEYSSLVDQGGGEFNAEAKTLTWPTVTLAPGQKQSRTIAVQMLNQIPSTNAGTSDGTSYDCKMINTFGNSISVNVECPTEKVAVEQVVNELPHTGPRENMMFAAVLLSVVIYFYARSRQLGKEVRLIRRNLNTGTI